jgi:hypothetical protein
MLVCSCDCNGADWYWSNADAPAPLATTKGRKRVSCGAHPFWGDWPAALPLARPAQ